ncbi:MAG: hypothetical protein OXC46_11780 [Thaumarchaeota archaeon]|nr:hypothetical protein [Nitrososphaerota archaeon]
MIKKKNIGLVIDTNILVDIVKSSTSGDLVQLLISWIKKIITSMDIHPKGKIITIFASTEILKDYRTGLCRNQYCDLGRRINLVFDRELSHKRFIDRENNIRFSLRKLQTKPHKKFKLTDKGDERFLVLLETIMKKQQSDRAIIFASRDMLSIDEIRSILNKFTISFAESNSELVQVIKC